MLGPGADFVFFGYYCTKRGEKHGRFRCSSEIQRLNSRAGRCFLSQETAVLGSRLAAIAARVATPAPERAQPTLWSTAGLRAVGRFGKQAFAIFHVTTSYVCHSVLVSDVKGMSPCLQDLTRETATPHIMHIVLKERHAVFIECVSWRR